MIFLVISGINIWAFDDYNNKNISKKFLNIK